MAWATESRASTVMILPLTRSRSEAVAGVCAGLAVAKPRNAAPLIRIQVRSSRKGFILEYRALRFAAFFSFHQDAGVPLIVFGMNVAEPEITLHAVHSCGEVAGFVGGRDALAGAVGSGFVIVGVQHGRSELFAGRSAVGGCPCGV